MINFENLSAYELIKQEPIEDVQSTGYYLRHKKSGARVLLLENEDENKVFNIAFRTTPANSTGVAHIMEHTVLCGSRKFPSKDPFVELVKGSMNTFLNAMTYPDKTMFPVASCNDRDFANLMDVYLDAVFFPNIYKTEEIFRQEGWHYQIEKAEDPICYNGVVYNEMKGAYSSPDDVLEREIMNSLFPDTVYHHESGGDPERIPDLTYEEYLDFHRTYYHPCNSYIYLYGKMDFEERLTWLDQEYLSNFEICEVHSEVGYQKPFEEMQIIRKEYPIAQEEPEEDNTYLAYNLVIGTSLDTRLATAMAVLDYVLLSSQGAPLKQALLDAGVGKDIMASYDSGIYQPVFSVIAKYANESDQERFLEIIREELTRSIEQGLDENALRAAINIMEFRFREADYGVYPKGLMYGIDTFDSWLYDDDKPFDYLKQLNDFAFLKEKIGTGYFEGLIRDHLLNNNHATLLVVSPKKGLTAEADQAVRDHLDAYKASLTEEQIEDLVKKTEKLRLFQETPSTQEELEAIPMLGREDMKKEAAVFRNKIVKGKNAWILHHDYATNGISYIRLLFDASCLDAEDLPYLGLLKCILGSVDTKNHSYKDLNYEINMRTGGIGYALSQFPDAADPDTVKLALNVSIRTLEEEIPYCFDIVKEILLTSNLDQDKRILEIIRRQKSRVGTALTESGSSTAASRCMSYFSQAYAMSEGYQGIDYYETVKALEENYNGQADALKTRLKAILEKILGGGRLLISFTGDEKDLDLIAKGAEELTEAISEAYKTDVLQIANAEDVIRPFGKIELSVKNEGFKTSGQVQYVAKCGNFRKAGYEYAGALSILRTIMSYEYLWSNIRVIGGAYGCSGIFLRNGDTGFTSYRDPQLTKTLEVYDGVPEYVENFTVDERDMTKYVIGTMSRLDTPLNPSALGLRSANSFLSGLTFERVQEERDQVLAVKEDDIRALAPLMRAALEQNCICVLGNEERIEENKDLFGSVRTIS